MKKNPTTDKPGLPWNRAAMTRICPETPEKYLKAANAVADAIARTDHGPEGMTPNPKRKQNT